MNYIMEKSESCNFYLNFKIYNEVANLLNKSRKLNRIIII